MYQLSHSHLSYQGWDEFFFCVCAHENTYVHIPLYGMISLHGPFRANNVLVIQFLHNFMRVGLDVVLCVF